MAYVKSQGYSIFRHSHATSVARCTKHAECVAGNGAHLRVKHASDGMGNVRALPGMGCAAFVYAGVFIRSLRSSLGAGTSPQMLVEGAGEHAGDVVTKSIDPALTVMVDTLLQARICSMAPCIELGLGAAPVHISVPSPSARRRPCLPLLPACRLAARPAASRATS